LWSRHAIDSLYHGDGLYHIYYLAYANTHLGVLVLEYTKIWWSIAVEQTAYAMQIGVYVDRQPIGCR